eukprot:PITA_16037
MARVSDSPPLEKDFSDWEWEVERSDETIKQMLQEKKLASKRPSNVAAEKDRVRREMELAESRHDYSEVRHDYSEVERIKIKPLNLNLKAGEAGHDPFTRRWTQSQNYYDTKAKVAEDNTDANKEADAAKIEEAIAIETAEDDGKLVGNDAPVSEDAKVYSLHDFELPNSLAGLQKYGGAQGAPLAFMARKQKLSSSIR